MATMSRVRSSTDAFHAVADPNRRLLLELLRDGERSVGELALESCLSYSATSQHLAVLVEAGLLGRRPRGTQRLYFLNPAALRAVHDWTVTFAPLWRAQAAERDDLLGETA
jgi:DNA-binding transcriptional ArsR family regulator